MKALLILFSITILSTSALEAQDTNSSTLPPAKGEIDKLLTYKKNKFSYGDYKNVKIEKRFLGLFPYGYTVEFRKTIETNPYAYRLLKRSYQYQAMETSASTIAWGLAIRSFVEMFNSVKRVTSGDYYPGNNTLVTNTTNAILTYSFALYGGSKKVKYFKLSIEEFNKSK